MAIWIAIYITEERNQEDTWIILKSDEHLGTKLVLILAIEQGQDAVTGNYIALELHGVGMGDKKFAYCIYKFVA